MGMSTHVVGIIPPDDTWRKMKAIWDSCKAAGIEPPQQVQGFFGDEAPDERGVVVEIEEYQQAGKSCTIKWSSEYASGFEVHIDLLPKHVKVVRFYNSW